MGKTIFIGGLSDDVTEALLRAALIPFGPLSEVSLPLDAAAAAGKNRGFGFATYEDEGDAAAAIENLDGAELLGRTLRVNASKERVRKDRAVWEDAKEWFEGLGKGDGGGEDARRGGGGGGGGDDARRGGGSAPGACFKCGVAGHFARECTSAAAR